MWILVVHGEVPPEGDREPVRNLTPDRGLQTLALGRHVRTQVSGSRSHWPCAI